MHTTEQLNTALAGRYTIDRLIGEGGMATVYLARDLKHNRKVALKVLKPDLGAVVGPDRFLSEIQVTANLQHPNLLPLFDSGATDGLLFYVMPFVDGESLRARIQREKQLPIDEAVRLATAIANALDYAHRHGVIHRDLKPENILLHEGQPLVADFGIALAVSNAGGSRITQTGLSLGTPQYMSPEQATGDRAIDGRTDIYSLGALTYEMLTGEPPHTGSTSQAVIARVLTERPRAVRMSRPNVPEQVEATVERALEKLPADRWATAKEFCEALTGARVVTRSTSARVVEGRVSTRTRAREIAAWALFAVTTAALAFLALRPDPVALPPAQVEFEVQLPDSVDPSPRGSVASLALSRDGQTLVFQAMGPDGGMALYVRRLDEREVQRVRGTDSARAPSLSPDGTELLFVTGGLGGTEPVVMRRIPLRGGSSRVLWEPVTGAPASWVDTAMVVFGVDSAIYRGPAQGGTRTLLAKPDSARGHTRYGFPDVLPGSRAALITISTGRGTDSSKVGLVSIPDGEVTDLGIQGTMPRYSGTGHIVYGTADGELRAVPFDAQRLRVLGAPFLVAQAVRVGSGGAAAFTVAPNGTVAYIPGSVGDERSLLVIDRSGNARDLGVKAAYHAMPRVSPDGRQIAVVVATVGGPGLANSDIWRIDTASRIMARVTTDSGSVRPFWNTDGSRIGYLARRGDSVVVARGLYASAPITPLVRVPGQVRDVSWGPPKGYSAIKIRPGNNNSDDIWVVHNDSLGHPRQLLAEPYEEQSPEVSPDGQLLAYISNRTGSNELYVRQIVGGAEVQVTTGGATEPVWAPDGREIFYRSPGFLSSARLSRAPLAATGREQLFRDPYPRNAEQRQYDVFPDGQHFLMMRQMSLGATPPIIVRTNWHVRPQARAP